MPLSVDCSPRVEGINIADDGDYDITEDVEMSFPPVTSRAPAPHSPMDVQSSRRSGDNAVPTVITAPIEIPKLKKTCSDHSLAIDVPVPRHATPPLGFLDYGLANDFETLSSSRVESRRLSFAGAAAAMDRQILPDASEEEMKFAAALPFGNLRPTCNSPLPR